MALVPIVRSCRFWCLAAYRHTWMCLPSGTRLLQAATRATSITLDISDMYIALDISDIYIALDISDMYIALDISDIYIALDISDIHI